MPTNYLQLIAKGAQDKYLTVNPQFSYWKSVYRRHTNFGMTSIEVPMMGDTSFGGLCRSILPRQGDLIEDIYLSIELPSVMVTGPNPSADGGQPSVRWTSKLGHAMIDYIEIAIGNQVIDRHTGEWLELYSQLTMTDERKKLYNNMIGQKGSLINDAQTLDPQFLYVPLQFWFCRRSGMALPLCALQIHDVEIRIKLRSVKDLLLTFDANNVITAGKLENISLFCNYIHLDDLERRKFANMEHSYLIEQVQYSGMNALGGGRGNSAPLFFNHPVKELIWTGQRLACTQSQFVLNSDGFPDYNDYFNYSNTSTPGEALNMFETFLLQINGNDLIPAREANYYNMYVPWRHHTNAPDTGVFCYSFCLEPEKHQPSGSLNFSKLDSANIKVEFNDAASLPIVLKVYARSYNILIIQSGIGFLEFQM